MVVTFIIGWRFPIRRTLVDVGPIACVREKQRRKGKFALLGQMSKSPCRLLQGKSNIGVGDVDDDDDDSRLTN
jgi:hypothetical protein